MEWISVKERIPEKDVEVLVYDCNADHVYVNQWCDWWEAPVSFSSKTICVGEGWETGEFEHITHWMPLPQPPMGSPPQQEREGVMACPEPPPECETEAEKRAFAFGWWKAMEAQRTDGVKTCPSTGNTCRSNCSERECWMKAKASLTGSGEVPAGVSGTHGKTFSPPDADAAITDAAGQSAQSGGGNG